MPIGDLSSWATATYLVGHDTEADDLWARAHAECLEHGDSAHAARCAFWLGLGLMLRGEMARGSAWLGRAQRVLEDVTGETAEHGYLLVPAGLQAMGGGDVAAAYALFSQAVDLADRFGDRDLLAFARLGQGQVLVKQGETSRGLALLDETMVAVTAGEVGAVVAGIVFCAVIEACHDAFDVRRAQEWTMAMTRWCATQPDLVPYRGQCSIYRAEVLRLHGEWEEALDEALQACERLGRPPAHSAVGMAHYEVGELLRLRGQLDAAEEAYREANRTGRSPQPGLGLLNLSRGRTDTARAALLHALDGAKQPLDRARLLGAVVEAELAEDDVPAGRAGVDELKQIAAESDAPALRGAAGYAEGAVQLAEGDDRAAALNLRETLDVWREVDAPYEAARTRVLMALSCRRLGDFDTAELDLDAACSTFAQLGASTDLATALALTESRGRPGAADGLTSRELEVLQLVAAGRTNRAIAGELTLSEHTVRRHLQNIFAKLDVPSRTAATAYAFRHDLV
ncbi:MAG TPA: response regulator transcription factor [Marmoricola sp.]|nr:response regulator transcription factor [Marmoricola sp.]